MTPKSVDEDHLQETGRLDSHLVIGFSLSRSCFAILAGFLQAEAINSAEGGVPH